MGETWWLVAAVFAVLVLAAAAIVWRPIRSTLRERQLARARRDFHQQRERLEARFVQLASRSGKPRGLAWVNCEFEDDVVYARDRRSGQLSAFVAVTVSFEAVAGGGMEDVEAVGNLRAATAIFRHVRQGWATDGRAVFNLNPTETVRYFHDDLELVGREAAGS
jgi:hypothetical protein